MSNTWADMITETTVSIDQTANKTEDTPKFDFYKEKYGESDYVLMFWNPQQPLEQWMIKDLLESIDVKARGIRVGKTGKCYADFENEEILESVKQLDGEKVGDVVITVSPVPKRADEPKRDFNAKQNVKQQNQQNDKRRKYQNQNQSSYREKKEQQEREGQNQNQNQDQAETRQINNTNSRQINNTNIRQNNNSFGRNQNNQRRYNNYNHNNSFGHNNHNNYNNYNQRRQNNTKENRENKENEQIETLKPVDPVVTEVKEIKEIKEVKEIKENEVVVLSENNQNEKNETVLELNESNEIKQREYKEEHKEMKKENHSHSNNSFGKRGGYTNTRGRGGYQNHQNTNRQYQPKDNTNQKENKVGKVIDLDAQNAEKKEEKVVPEDQKQASFSTSKPRQFGEKRGGGNRRYDTQRKGGVAAQKPKDWDDMGKKEGHVIEIEVKKEESISLEKKEEDVESDDEGWQTVKGKKDQKKKGKKGGK